MYDVVFKSGVVGLLIWILLFVTSTAAAALIISIIWILRKKRFIVIANFEQLMVLLGNGDWNEAYRLCKENSSVVTRTCKMILKVAHSKNNKERQELAVGELDKEVRAVLRQINSLSLCGNIAPMLGLLGTVTGMVDAFMGLGTAMGPEKASILAISISHALYTTAAGLLIAVPAITFAVVFRNLLEKRTEGVTEALGLVLESIPEPEPEVPQVVSYSTDTAKIPGE